MAFVLALLALFALLSVVHGAPVASSGLPAPSWLPTDFPLSSFSRHALLADNVHMYWTLDTGKNSMLVGVVGTFDRDAEGSYLGIGLSPTGGMKGSDIVLGFTDVSGKFMIQNRHAGGFYQPALASRQFAKLEYGVQSGNITAFVFSRPIVVDSAISCSDSDSKDWTDPDLRLQQWIVFAAGSMSRDRSNPMYHGPGDRGQVAVFLDGPETEPPKNDDGTETKFLELRPSEPNELPRNESTVYCYTYLELPRDRPYDAISISPILPPRGASAMRPHHFIVYNCLKEDGRKSAQDQFASTKCFTPSHVRQLFTPCERVWAGWATGGKELRMPSDVGMPLPPSVLLETHYDGSHGAGAGDAKDESGIRVEYTAELRSKEMQILELGILNSAISVPPGKEAHTQKVICPGVCTKGLGSGVKVFANWFHMHEIGSAASTYLLRRHANGTISRIDLGSVSDFDNSYQSQQLVFPSSAPELLPGDTAVTSFTWDSRDRRETTPGGLSTRDEMSINFLHILRNRKADVGGFGQCYAAESMEDEFEGHQGVYCDGQEGGEGIVVGQLPDGWTRETDREARCPVAPPATPGVLWVSASTAAGLFVVCGIAVWMIKMLKERKQTSVLLLEEDGRGLLNPFEAESEDAEDDAKNF